MKLEKLNLGSGQRPFKAPWINIDAQNQNYPQDINTIQTDAKSLGMFQSRSVEIIVTHHLVEHIPVHEVSSYVGEWHRVLKRDGKLAVFVPNLRELDKAWLDGKVDTYIHNVNTYGAYQNNDFDIHKWGYDEQELRDRIACKGPDGKCMFDWDVRIINQDTLREPFYQNSDCVLDWWILALEFTKRQ